MKLYFVRHGESEANVARIISNRELPHALTEKGRQQAVALADLLGRLIEPDSAPVSGLYSSPILRAMQTATILSARLGVPVQVSEALREYDCGVLEGQSDAQSWRLHSEISEDWIVRKNWQRRAEGGESFLDIRARFVPFVEGLLRNAAPQSSLVLVAHGGLYHLMLPLILQNIDADFVRQHPISYTGCILAEARPQGLVCLQWGETVLERLEG